MPFTLAISPSQENPNDSNLAIFIAILDLFPPCLGAALPTQGKGRTQPPSRMRPQASKPSRNETKAERFGTMISCIFSPLIDIHLPDTNRVGSKAIVSRNKDTKLNSSSLHRRDIQCSQPHRWKAETDGDPHSHPNWKISFC